MTQTLDGTVRVDSLLPGPNGTVGAERVVHAGREALVDRAVLAGLIVLAGLCALAVSHTAGVEDTFRDLYFAQRIATGAEWPAQGPVIGNIAYLGPVWFYLLGLPYLVGGPALTLAFMGFCAGLKYPMAFAVFRRLGVDRTGSLLAAAALAIPGWSSFDLLSPTHSSAAVLTLLALAWCCLGYVRRPGTVAALWLGLWSGLCLHAHPTGLFFVLVLAVPSLLLAAAGSLKHRCLQIGCAAMACALLLLPVAWGLFAGADDEIRGVSRYLESDLQAGVLQRVPRLLAASLWDGPDILLSLWLFPEPLGALIRTLLLAVSAVGVVLLLRRLPGAWALGFSVLVLASALFLLVLRPITPFWMTYFHLGLCLLLAGAGWHLLWNFSRGGRGLVILCVASVVLAQAALLRLIVWPADTLAFPSYAEGSPGMMSINSERAGVVDLPRPTEPLTSLLKQHASLCHFDVVYGHEAYSLDSTFGVGLRDHCERVGSVRLGGRLDSSERAIVTLGRSARRAIAGVATDAPEQGRFRAIESFADSEAFNIIPGGRFPWRDTSDFTPSQFGVSAHTGQGQLLLIANRAARLHGMALQSVSVDSGRARTLFDDGVVRILVCEECVDPARWELSLFGPRTAIDVVSFEAGTVQQR